MATTHDDVLLATWNVERGGKPATVRKILREELAAGVQVFLVQEVNAGTLKVFESEGLQITRTAHASNAVAWVPAASKHGRKGVVLAPDYLDRTANPDRIIHTHSPQVLLQVAGITIDALSFHTPSRVQRPSPEAARMRVLKAAIATISKQARTSTADVFVAGGDSNVHLTGSSKWAFMRDKVTGLRHIAPPKGTLGGRKIDVFFVRARSGVRVEVTGGWVRAGGGDHKLHRLRLRVTVSAAPKPVTTKPSDRMNPKSYRVGAYGDHVRWLASRLVAHGYGRHYRNGTDRRFTKGEDRRAVAAFQRAQGWRGKDADGLPGRETLRRLAATPRKKRKPAPSPAVARIKALVKPTRLPDNLPALLRSQGLTVVEISGWKTRKRPGLFGPVGTLWHHTGSYDKLADAADDLAYAKWLAIKGRSDLPAPLCQISISREGVLYLCAAGRSNHAGKAKAHGSVVAGDGNRLYVGIECMNDGRQGWDKAQRDAMVTTAYVLHLLLGTSTRALSGHKETSVTGKWDPGAFDMNKFRADVARRLTSGK